jgi:xanthine dehydrogenase accessory factor
MDGWDVIEQASELARRGQEFALATVVWRQPPSSGQVGSRAIITATGEIYGWIGGACAEPIVLREAKKVIADQEPRLLLLGAPEQFGTRIPEGMVTIPISCQSEGALEVYVEPVLPTPNLVVVDLAKSLGWRTSLIDANDFSAADVNARSMVVVATQGHGDEEVLEQAVAAYPAFVGLVGSRKRGEAVIGYLADRGVPQNLLDRVKVPVGVDLGHTSHREIAVAILAELVQVRAAGGLIAEMTGTSAPQTVTTVIDPVCGMTVEPGPSTPSVKHDGVTYYFCCVGCKTNFERDPHAYLKEVAHVD